MSLWQMPDKQTSLLMTTFYKKWLGEKMTIPEAFRAAQKELREAGCIRTSGQDLCWWSKEQSVPL
ncbi:MAG: CHAT domain-containing protein, partial [Thermoanaerobaculia bacterium]|nr:CHAT domain-containing protein [Thermoanaerobaculia bacterium]